MYCKKCGKFLAGNENFCSNCGAKVEVPEIIENEKMFETDKNEVESDNIKIMSPIDDIVWDVKEFPSSKHRKTEDANIKWRSDDMFLHKEIIRQQEEAMPSVTNNEELKEELKKDQEAEAAKAAEEAQAAKEAEEKKKTIDRLEIPSMFKDHSYSMPGVDKNRRDEEKSVVTRNTAPIDAEVINEEQVVNIQQPTRGIVLEVTEDGVERVRSDEPEMTSAIVDDIHDVGESYEEVDAHSDEDFEISQGEPSEDVEDTIIAEEQASEISEEKSLFDEIAPKAIETLEGTTINNETKKIDKFYTFNRKKEEFQKLLDKEYERIERKCEPGGLEDDITSFMDVQTGRAVEGTSQLEEMVRARELFFDDPYYVPKEEIEPEEPETEENDAEEELQEIVEEQEVVEEGEVAKVVFEPENDEPLSASLEDETADEEQEEEASNAEEKTSQTEENEDVPMTAEDEAEEEEPVEKDKEPEIARVIIDPSKKDATTEELAKEFFDGQDEEVKRSKGTRVAIWILSIVIVIVSVLLIIRIAMPNTVVSKYMDKVANSAINLITGNDEKSEEATKENDSVREGLVEDKSGLIQLEIDNNYKNAIANIKYNGDAKYDSNKSYAIANLKEPKEIQTNVWYKDDNGDTHYYDQEIVGTIIAFESQRVALLNDGDKAVYNIVAANSRASDKVATEENNKVKIKSFDSLEIGEIKVAGNAYYVWVIETINGKSTPKVYEIKEADQKLQVTDVSEA